MSTTRTTGHRFGAHRSGLAVAALGVAASAGVNTLFPTVSALIVAVVLGVAAGNLGLLPASARAGLARWTPRMLRIGVPLLGLQLALPRVLALGPGLLLAVAVTVAVTFAGTLWLGRLLGVSRALRILVATGFSICGASAVAAVASVVDHDDEDVATAISLVTVFGGLAIVGLPALAGPLGVEGTDLGRWAGLGVHEVGQVVAAAAPAGAAAVAAAVLVKLSRVVLLAPVVTAVGVVERRRRPGPRGTRPPLVPLFVLGFLGAIAVRATGLLPAPALDGAATLTTWVLAAALFGLGTSIGLRTLVGAGPRALALGALSTVLVGSVSLASLRLLA
ncbi:YeiH family protein [Pseudonocardia adelaidensis]